MAYISDTALSHLLKVVGYLKAAENEFEQATEHDDWLADTVDTEGLVNFQAEITNYIACNVQTDCMNDVDCETLLDFKNQVSNFIAGKIKMIGKQTITFE